MGGDGVLDTDLEGRRGLLHGRFGVLIKIEYIMPSYEPGACE